MSTRFFTGGYGIYRELQAQLCLQPQHFIIYNSMIIINYKNFLII